VAWLANKLSEFGLSLKTGEIILSGAVTAAPPAAGGDVFNVHFDRLGSVSAKFSS
jgi:2-keto-4-pentenoate hydratase